MGNYYEGRLRFRLKENIPKDVLHDLLFISSNEYSSSDFVVLQNEKWGKHIRYDFPTYYLQLAKHDNHEYYLFNVDFCMKGYYVGDDCLGEDIYDFLKQYIDESCYDMSDGGYIGEIHDEDGTYDKIFYVNYDEFNKKLKVRKHLCNENCHYYRKDILCDKFEVCGRAYQIGKQAKE